MTFEKFTIKAQEAVQSAINIAQRNGQQTIEPVHILAGVMDKRKRCNKLHLPENWRQCTSCGDCHSE